MLQSKGCCSTAKLLFGYFGVILLTCTRLRWSLLPELSSSHLLPFNPALPNRLCVSVPVPTHPLALLHQPFNLGEIYIYIFLPLTSPTLL